MLESVKTNIEDQQDGAICDKEVSPIPPYVCPNNEVKA